MPTRKDAKGRQITAETSFCIPGKGGVFSPEEKKKTPQQLKEEREAGLGKSPAKS